MSRAPLRLYAASHEGVFVLNAMGDKTEIANEAFRGAIVDCVHPRPGHPEIVFAGVTHDGLYRSDDAGKSWQKVIDGDLRAIAVDPSDDRVVYAGTEPVHLYRSEDGGKSFAEIASLQSLPEQTRQKHPAPARVDTHFSNPKFRHGPQEWTFPLPPHEGHITEIFIRPDDPDEIYLSIEHGGIARSNDRGKSWDDASQGIDYLDIHRLLRLPQRADRYVVSSARGLYASDDPTRGWQRAENGVARDYFHEMMVLPAARGDTRSLLVCTADGSPVRWPATKGDGVWHKDAPGARAALYRSDDGARSWRRIGLGRGLPEEMGPMIWSLQPHPHETRTIFAGTGEVARGYAFGTAGSGAILLSEDEGESWRKIAGDLPALRQLAVVAA
ncbi:MAG TPA: hypothetical protein VGL83_21290 [Stellaceae bacterium]|jgi:photosystem II stability/assembly factor-like uncharacterized protein